MNIYEKQFLHLIKEYNLEITNFVDSVQIHSIILELFQKRCLKKKIALWGAGYNNTLTSHASVLLTKYATCLQGVECLVDSCKEVQGKTMMGYPIIAPEQLTDRDVDIVIISSRSSAESIKKSLFRAKPHCEYIDIYQELRDRGIFIHYNFYEERSFYSEIYDVRIAYEETAGEEKQKQLRKLIASYLHIKDFLYAFSYIEEYIREKYEGYERLEEFRVKLGTLIKTVKEKNRARTGDINIHYIDALRACDTYDYEHPGQYKVLKAFLDESAVFTNIHSTAPTTYESIYSVTTGKYSFTENVYEDRFIFKADEFPVMRKAIELGYDVNLYTSAEWRIIHESKDVRYINQIHLTDKLWKLACDAAVSEKDMFNYLYYPWELHFPLLCGYHRRKPVAMGFKDVGIVDMSDFIEGQLKDCLDYVDKEMTYYKEIIPDNGYTVLFSDHSQIVYDYKKCVPYFAYYNDSERATHCVMAIKGPGIWHREYKELVSLIEFNEILKDFIWNHSYLIHDSEIIRYQYYSIHNKQFRDVAEEKGLTDYINGIQCFMSKEYIYIQTQTGVEEVYKRADTETNIISSPEGQRFAGYIKGKYDIDFPTFLEIHY